MKCKYMFLKTENLERTTFANLILLQIHGCKGIILGHKKFLASRHGETVDVEPKGNKV